MDLRKAPFNVFLLIFVKMTSVCCVVIGSLTCNMVMGSCLTTIQREDHWMVNCEEEMSGIKAIFVRLIMRMYYDNTAQDFSVS